MTARTSRSQHTLHSIRDPPQRMLASTARARFTSLLFSSPLLSNHNRHIFTLRRIHSNRPTRSRNGGVTGGEIAKTIIIIQVIEISILSSWSFIEIQRITKGIVLEFPMVPSVTAAAVFISIESPNESFPLRTRNNF